MNETDLSKFREKLLTTALLKSVYFNPDAISPYFIDLRAYSLEKVEQALTQIGRSDEKLTCSIIRRIIHEFKDDEWRKTKEQEKTETQAILYGSDAGTQRCRAIIMALQAGGNACKELAAKWEKEDKATRKCSCSHNGYVVYSKFVGNQQYSYTGYCSRCNPHYENVIKNIDPETCQIINNIVNRK